ncbi:MAG: sporulation protein YqfD [Bacilli bacterium]|nr:sporulation protein YqfD [Bacilli bacterium]
MYSRLKIEILGNNPDYFLKKIITEKINIYHLERETKRLILIIDYSDYQKIKDIKTTYKINIINRYGFNKLEYYFKKFYLLIVFLLLGIMMNIVLSQMIFKIEVIHPNKEIRKIVLKDLNELGIKKYHFKVNYERKEKIKEKLKEKEKIIDWIEIEEYGTKYIVKVEEKKFNKKKDKCLPRNIISKKNALILDIDAYSGEVKKSINNYVSKGEVIISGFIYNKDEIVSKRCAKGKVYGEVWYQVKVDIPKYKEEEELLSNKKIGITLKIFNKEYKIIKPYKRYKKDTYNIIKSKFIPVSLSINKYQKTKVKYKKLTNKELNKLAFKASVKEINKRLKKDEKILNKKILKKIEKNSKIEVDIFVNVQENITDYQDISKITPEEMNKKEE